MKKKMLSVLLCTCMLSGLVIGCTKNEVDSDNSSKTEMEEISLLVDNATTLAGFEAVAELAEEKIGVKVNIETRPGGSDGDNVVKTRLASGDMADLCFYNAGSLLNALNPAEYFIDLSGEEFMSRVDEAFASTVTIGEATYGIPFSSSQVGAILYSKPLYEKYNLEVPNTWDEFLKNCDVLKEAGETAILGTFADSWTAQVLYLGDAYNLQKAQPDFVENFDAGKAKWASTPEALRSFEKLEETVPYYNEDYLATTYDDGCDIMANGEAGHWVMLSQVLSNIYELYGDKVNDLGIFPIPGDTPEDNGMTVWYSGAIYGNKNSDKQEAILKFMEFYVSDEALDAYTSAVLPDGPYCVKGYELPEGAYDAVAVDIQKYFDEGKTLPAIEFIGQVKGSEAPTICQELGSGQTTAKEAAEKYDADCAKQATQLGLNW